MSILTDGVHLVSDESEDELHRFAQGIGLKREWFQADHYDVFRGKVNAAVDAGALVVSRRRIAEVARRHS